MALLDDVKATLRITSTSFNTEVTDLIAAAKQDLTLTGINCEDETDSLIKRAIITYCKGNFGYNNQEAERFLESYEKLKAHLALSGDYVV